MLTATRPATFMPFGRHRGKPLRAVPLSYLRWLLHDCRGLGDPLWLAVQGELGRRHALRQAEWREAERQWGLPDAEPLSVGGVQLTRAESALFLDAARAGRLPEPLPLWLPIASPLPGAFAGYVSGEPVRWLPDDHPAAFTFGGAAR